MIDRVLPLVDAVLSEKGIFYMVVIRENKPEEIVELMSGRGFQGTTVLSRRAGREGLSILRFVRIK